MTFRVLANDGMDKEGVSILTEAGILVDLIKKDGSNLLKNIGNYDALTVRSATKVDKEVISAGAERLKLIGRAGVGVDNIDVDAATEYGLIVKNAPNGNTNATAELSLGLMLAVARKIAKADASMQRGEWNKKAFSGTELSHRTLGIIGCGRIGRRLSEIVSGFGMNVMGYDISPNPDAMIDYVPLEKLLRDSDYIAVHAGGTDWIIGEREIGMMKSSAILVNLARGEHVDPDALYYALIDGKIAGAGLDVHVGEPENNRDKLRTRLRGLDNVVLTPHLGASTKNAQIATSKEMATVIRDYLQKGDLTNAINVGQDVLHEQGRKVYQLFVYHKDAPGAFAGITEILAKAGINLRDNPSKSMGNGYATTTFLLHSEPTIEVLKRIRGLDAVKRAVV